MLSLSRFYDYPAGYYPAVFVSKPRFAGIFEAFFVNKRRKITNSRALVMKKRGTNETVMPNKQRKLIIRRHQLPPAGCNDRFSRDGAAVGLSPNIIVRANASLREKSAVRCNFGRRPRFAIMRHNLRLHCSFVHRRFRLFRVVRLWNRWRDSLWIICISLYKWFVNLHWIKWLKARQTLFDKIKRISGFVYVCFLNYIFFLKKFE